MLRDSLGGDCAKSEQPVEAWAIVGPNSTAKMPMIQHAIPEGVESLRMNALLSNHLYRLDLLELRISLHFS